MLYAAKALIRIDAAAFAEFWKGEYSDIHMEVRELLSKLGDEGVEPLALALRREPMGFRLDIVEALGKTKSVRAVPYLIQALKYEEDANVVSAIYKVVTKFKGVKTSDKGKCPICGTNLKFWDAREVKCYFCGANLRVDGHKLTEYISTNVTDSPQEKVIIYILPSYFVLGESIAWPDYCCLCLNPVTPVDYCKMNCKTALETITNGWEIKQSILEMTVQVPYCKGCRSKVKKLFGHGEQEAVSVEMRKAYDSIHELIPKTTFSFRNPQFAHLFRQANKQLIAKGRKMMA
jgi:hypothetical protein